MRQFTTGIILLSLASLVLGGCGGSGGGSANTGSFVAFANFSEQVPITSQTRLRASGVNGTIDVHGSATATSVAVSGVMKVISSSSLSDAQQHLSDLDVVVTAGSAEVTVETVQPMGPTGTRHYVVEYTITIPDWMRVDATQANGDVLIEGIDSDIAATQANGPIAVDAALPPNGIIDLGTANGNISLTIPTSTSAVLSCRSATGTVSHSGLNIRNRVQTRNSLTGTLGGGNGRIVISTANGGITLRGT